MTEGKGSLLFSYLFCLLSRQRKLTVFLFTRLLADNGKEWGTFVNPLPQPGSLASSELNPDVTWNEPATGWAVPTAAEWMFLPSTFLLGVGLPGCSAPWETPHHAQAGREGHGGAWVDLARAQLCCVALNKSLPFSASGFLLWERSQTRDSPKSPSPLRT